jgi:hypothetical protein
LIEGPHDSLREALSASGVWATVRLVALWTIARDPEVFDHANGHDGYQYKWPLTREGYNPLFTMVKMSDHAKHGLGSPDRPMTPRALEAVETNGRSEVERYLDWELPPRVIEVGTAGDPVVTAVRE